MVGRNPFGIETLNQHHRKTKILTKINAPKHKSQTQLTPKLLGFSKTVLGKNLRKFYLCNNRLFEASTANIAEVTNCHFWKLLATIDVSLNFRSTYKTVFRRSF